MCAPVLYDAMNAGVLTSMSTTASATGNSLKATALGKNGANGGSNGSKNTTAPTAAAEDDNHSYRRQQLDESAILMCFWLNCIFA